MLPYIWLIPLAPLAGFVVIGLLTMYGKLPAKVAGRVGGSGAAVVPLDWRHTPPPSRAA